MYFKERSTVTIDDPYAIELDGNLPGFEFNPSRGFNKLHFISAATAQSFYFADFSQAFTTAQIGTYTTDTIHPNIDGHTLIANNVLFPVIQQTNFYQTL